MSSAAAPLPAAQPPVVDASTAPDDDAGPGDVDDGEALAAAGMLPSASPAGVSGDDAHRDGCGGVRGVASAAPQLPGSAGGGAALSVAPPAGAAAAAGADGGLQGRFRGISHRPDGRWKASFCAPGGKPLPLGHFANDVDAARAWDAAARRSGRTALNFPDEAAGETRAQPYTSREGVRALGAPLPNAAAAAGAGAGAGLVPERYRGTYRHPSGGWKASYCLPLGTGFGTTKTVHLGYFPTAADAARAWDAAARRAGRTELNFPDETIGETRVCASRLRGGAAGARSQQAQAGAAAAGAAAPHPPPRDAARAAPVPVPAAAARAAAARGAGPPPALLTLAPVAGGVRRCAPRPAAAAAARLAAAAHRRAPSFRVLLF